MLPVPSIAIVLIQRLVASVETVPSWNSDQGPAAVLRRSNQRTPARLAAFTSVAKLPTITSCVPRFRYCGRFITTSRSGSSGLAPLGWGMQLNDVRPQRLESNSDTVMLVGPVNVELAGVAKSTWNSNSWTVSGSAAAPPCDSASRWRRKTAGAPAGGGVAPSQSAGGSIWNGKPESGGVAMKRCAVAAAPVSIADRWRA